MPPPALPPAPLDVGGAPPGGHADGGRAAPGELGPPAGGNFDLQGMMAQITQLQAMQAQVMGNAGRQRANELAITALTNCLSHDRDPTDDEVTHCLEP